MGAWLTAEGVEDPGADIDPLTPDYLSELLAFNEVDAEEIDNRPPPSMTVPSEE
jgi:hypothetical protein